MDLPEFLLARIAEDEEAAQRVSNRWTALDVDGFIRTERGSEVLWTDEEAHILRHDPARVLAECTAKRAMIQAWPDPMGQWNAAEADAARAMKRQVLLAWARVYADHPDFDPAWR